MARLRDSIPRATTPAETKTASDEMKLYRVLLAYERAQNAIIMAKLLSQQHEKPAESPPQFSPPFSKLFEDIQSMFSNHLTEVNKIVNRPSEYKEPNSINKTNEQTLLEKEVRNPHPDMTMIEKMLLELLAQTKKQDEKIDGLETTIHQEISPSSPKDEPEAKLEAKPKARPVPAPRPIKPPQKTEYRVAVYTGNPPITITFKPTIDELLGEIPDDKLRPDKQGAYNHYFVVGSKDTAGKIQYIISPILDFTGTLSNLSLEIVLIYLAVPAAATTGPPRLLDIWGIYEATGASTVSSAGLYSQLVSAKQSSTSSVSRNYGNIIKT